MLVAIFHTKQAQPDPRDRGARLVSRERNLIGTNGPPSSDTAATMLALQPYELIEGLLIQVNRYLRFDSGLQHKIWAVSSPDRRHT